MKFISKNDYDQCLKKGGFIDKVIEIPLNGKTPEQIMTEINYKNSEFRLCKAIKSRAGKCFFTKRTYLPNAEVDPEKYAEYFEAKIMPIIEKSNRLIMKKFPNTSFY